MGEVSLRYITVVLCVDLYFSPDNCLNPFNQHIYSIGEAEKCWEGLRSAGLRHYFWIGGAGAGAAVAILCEHIYHSLRSAHLSLNQTVWCLLEQFCWPDRGCSFSFTHQSVAVYMFCCKLFPVMYLFLKLLNWPSQLMEHLKQIQLKLYLEPTKLSLLG